MTIALIRVFSTTDETVKESHGKIVSDRYGIPVKTYLIPDQPFGIHDDASETLAVPKIVAITRQAQDDGAHLVLISCAIDPAVAVCRQELTIPVIGAGSAAAGTAIAFGSRIGVLNLNSMLHPRIAALLGDRLTAQRSPVGVNNTTDLLTDWGKQAAQAAARELAEQCDVIMFACTGFSTIGLAAELRQVVSIPIVDAVEAAGGFAWQLLWAGRNTSIRQI